MKSNKGSYMEAKKENETFKILSLDGGGIRGLFSISLLAKLEQEFNVKCTDIFDMFAGTSTGSIIALGLASGMTASEIQKFYQDIGPKIFTKKPSLWNILFAKHNANNLKRSLEQIFKQKTVQDVMNNNKYIIIPATNLSGPLVTRIFKTDYKKEFNEHNTYKLCDIALASSSAPTYFKTCGISKPNTDSKEYFCDGGLFANNPGVCAITEAVKHLQKNVKEIKMLSIPTESKFRKKADSKPRRGFLTGWGEELIETTLHATTQINNYIAEFILAENYFRAEPLGHIQNIKLDDANEKTLNTLVNIGHSTAVALKNSPFIQDIFKERITIEQNA